MDFTYLLELALGPLGALIICLAVAFGFSQGRIRRGKDYDDKVAECAALREALDGERAERLKDAKDTAMLARALVKIEESK